MNSFRTCLVSWCSGYKLDTPIRWKSFSVSTLFRHDAISQDFHFSKTHPALSEQVQCAWPGFEAVHPCSCTCHTRSCPAMSPRGLATRSWSDERCVRGTVLWSRRWGRGWWARVLLDAMSPGFLSVFRRGGQCHAATCPTCRGTSPSVWKVRQLCD